MFTTCELNCEDKVEPWHNGNFLHCISICAGHTWCEEAIDGDKDLQLVSYQNEHNLNPFVFICNVICGYT